MLLVLLIEYLEDSGSLSSFGSKEKDVVHIPKILDDDV
jgi:hypothetical protein